MRLYEQNILNVMDDLINESDDEIRCLQLEEPGFFPGEIHHQCKRCEQVTLFIPCTDPKTKVGSSIVFTMIADMPTVLISKVYKSSWCGSIITLNQVYEEVGRSVDYGSKVFMPEDVMKKLD